MNEIISVVIVGAFMAGCVYAGFLGGRDASERKAAETVANLRRRLMVVTSQRDRAVENNARLARALGLQLAQLGRPRVDEPMTNAELLELARPIAERMGVDVNYVTKVTLTPVGISVESWSLSGWHTVTEEVSR